ncbi:hypothetical protein M9Y10_014612 [Tritrichomonas musculus]|uniref:alpha-L-rhamnosidase n=1 Tax=Tritrichomonas musculus TaxID=1915356 RepID=A0ABR2L0I4_9EUKA
MQISKIRINGIICPIGYLFDKLRCSWTVSDTKANHTDFVKIEISKDEKFEKIIYHKEGHNLNSACEVLEMALEPCTRYYIRVQVTADNKEQAQKISFFETSKLNQKWEAKWIKPHPEDKYHPLFEKEFQAKENISSARLYISGLGLYSAKINGKKVGEEILTPYMSDYHTEVQYQTYDIIDYLQKNNQISVELGNGWYKGFFGIQHKDQNYGSEFQLIAEIHIHYKDGSEEVIGTDESWLYSGSDIQNSDIYHGEIIDHLLWKDKENKKKNPIEGGIEGKLIERYSLQVTEHEEVKVKEVIHTPAGETVLDFGQNFAGYVQFNANLKEGTKITLDYGEILQKGNFYNANYRDAKAHFIYVSNGNKETVKPTFTYYGFRYVRVTGWPGDLNPNDFIGKALYSNMDITGHIETGHEKVNKLFSNVMWGQKSNFIDFPTDCPQRDERLGWTGDAQVFSGTASYNMYTAAFYNKFIHDLRVEQKKLDGIIPGYIPVLDVKSVSFGAVWGDVATFLPIVLYEHFGDAAALELYYPMMKDWVDVITKEDKKRGQQKFIFDFKDQFGDWLALDGRTSNSFKGATDDPFIASCYYAMSSKMVSDVAKILGKEEDALAYSQLHDNIRDAVLRSYFTETGRLAIDTQTGYIVSLYSGIYRDIESIISGLRERLFKDCFKIKGGFVGAPIMCKIMAENGLIDEAFYFLLQERFPGWFHCIDLGATTIWERWNSVLDNGLLSGILMNSLNHYAFGSVVEFLYKNVFGISAIEPGFKKVKIAPNVNSKLHYLKGSYDSIYGTYKVDWEILKDGNLHIKIEIPFDCTGIVVLPYNADQKEQELGPGVYEFNYKPTRNLLARYTTKTLFIDMSHDEEAMNIIKSISPMLHHLLTTRDEDFLNQNIETLSSMAFLGFDSEVIHKLTDDLTSLICK